MKAKITIVLVFYMSCGVFFDRVWGQANLPFEDNFNSGFLNPNWWDPKPNISGVDGVVEIVNNIGVNSSKGVRIGKLSDYSGFTTNALDLHLNLLGQDDVEMTFWILDRWDNTDDDDGIYFSDDGGSTFVKVLDFKAEEWCDNVYGQYPPIDVDELASLAGLALTSQFVIRFQQRGENDFYGGGSDGFYIDEVKVYDPELVYATLPFEDDFETGLMKKSWAWNFADETSTVPSVFEPTGPMNVVGVGSEIGLNYSYGVAMGRRCDGAFTTNALDLHLNLLGQDDVEMTFWILDRWDNTDDDDGIYFSDDGGSTFVKVLDFDFSNMEDNYYYQYTVDVSSLATANSVDLTGSFVIRFQQRGENDFYGGGSDGVYIDEVRVMGTSTRVESLVESNLVSLYPMPNDGRFYIDFGYANAKVIGIEVYDCLGKVLYREERNGQDLQSYEVDISTAPTGMYYLLIRLVDGEEIIRRVMKK